jgi:ABC-type transport system substrate-binding protein
MPIVNVNVFTRPYVRSLELNLNRPYLADVRVRQALSHAVHRQVLCDSVLSGLAEPWYSFMEYDTWLNQTMPTYAYDPEKAKELLAAAEADGAWDPDTEIEIAFYYSAVQDRNFMAGLQTFFTDIGIKTRLAYYETAAATAKQSEGDFDLMYFGWGSSPEPDDYAAAFQCDNTTRGAFYGAMSDVCNPMADLFKQGVTVVAFDERKAIYDEIQQLFGENLPFIPLFRFKQAMAINTRVSGFELGAQTYFAGFVFSDHRANEWSVSA